MNIQCIICSEQLLLTEELYSTPCGHVFHLHCVSEWLERAKSCPQCRQKTTPAKIHRLYFNNSNNDSIDDFVSTLQTKVENFEAELVQKVKEINQLKSSEQTANQQIAALKERIQILSNDNNLQKKEVEKLQKQVEQNWNYSKNLEEELAFNKSVRKELEKKLKASKDNDQVSEDNTILISDVSPAVEIDKPQKRCLRSLCECSNDSGAKKSKFTSNAQIAGSPIVISDDSSDEGDFVDLTRDLKENGITRILRLKAKKLSALKELNTTLDSNRLSTKSTAQKGPRRIR